MKRIAPIHSALAAGVSLLFFGAVRYAHGDDKNSGMNPIQLSAEHVAAVNRPRRIIVEYDAFDPSQALAAKFDDWLKFRFDLIDDPASQIDSVWWDFPAGTGASARVNYPSLQTWHAQGIDPMRRLVEECRKRGLETFFSHRFSSVEHGPGGLEMKELSPLKAAHPDWVVKCWWWQGLWNLASEGLRDYKVSVIRGIAEAYDFDGIQINFARHIPCLPIGRQWELREHATTFIRAVRQALIEVGEARGRPYLLAVKVPNTIEGCRIDGFDVATWAAENLVDIFSVGSSVMTVDLSAFREITRGKPIKICPCFDDHHASDGYGHQPIEFLRGVYANWWGEGADAVETFNWSTSGKELADLVGAPPAYPRRDAHRQAYREIGSMDTMRGKDKIFAVERRGTFPWADGYFCRSDDAPLPIVLANHGRPVDVPIKVYEDLPDGTADVKLRVILFRATARDRMEVSLNGRLLELANCDEAWRDPQIFSPGPQPPKGSFATRRSDTTKQRLARFTFAVDPSQVHFGPNTVSVRIGERGPYLPGEDLQLEKVEVHVAYGGAPF